MKSIRVLIALVIYVAVLAGFLVAASRCQFNPLSQAPFVADLEATLGLLTGGPWAFRCVLGTAAVCAVALLAVGAAAAVASALAAEVDRNEPPHNTFKE